MVGPVVVMAAVVTGGTKEGGGGAVILGVGVVSVVALAHKIIPEIFICPKPRLRSSLTSGL